MKDYLKPIAAIIITLIAAVTGITVTIDKFPAINPAFITGVQK